MELRIEFPEGERVDAHLDKHRIRTADDDSEPNPLALFLASIGTCAGIYVSRFCRKRGISTDGMVLRQRMTEEAGSGMIREIEIEIDLPPGFPPRYEAALLRAADLCKVKKHLEQPPQIRLRTTATAG